MRKILLPALLLAAITPPLRAKGWSIGAGSGTVRSRLSAATRPGGSADIERDVNDWLGVRVEAAWTRAPMSF